MENHVVNLAQIEARSRTRFPQAGAAVAVLVPALSSRPYRVDFPGQVRGECGHWEGQGPVRSARAWLLQDRRPPASMRIE